MTDLHARFRALDRLPVPDLRDEIARRAEIEAAAVALVRAPGGHAAHQPAIGHPARRLAGVGATVLAAVLLLGTLAVVGGLLTPAPSPIPSPTLSPTPSIAAGPSLSLTGSMTTARCGHTGVRLLDGQVLIIGGWGEGDAVVVTPELFDPVTGTFRAVGGTTAAAEAMSATLLADGRVLVAGGRTRSAAGSTCGSMDAGVAPGQETADAFLFDPVTGRMEPTGRLGVPRFGHAAIRLDDGRVLVVGGQGTREDGTWVALSSAEVYDPASGTFESTGAMADPRGWSRVRGGGERRPMVAATGDGRVIVGGGETDVETLEVYDPATRSFTAFRPDPTTPLAPVTSVRQDCQCAETIDPRTGEIERVGHGRGISHQLPRNVLVGDLLIVVDRDFIAIDDIRTEPAGELSRHSDWSLTSLIGSSSEQHFLPSVTALDDVHVLIAGGTSGLSPTTDAQILTLAP